MSTVHSQGDGAADEEPVKAAKKIVLIRFGTPEKTREINAFSEAYFNRKFQEAEEMGADVVVVEIDSPGGRVDSSLNMAFALRDAKWATTVAYVPRQALSGAAIMSLGCDHIIMNKNAFIGDAGPIFMAEDFLFRHAPEKIRSDLVAKVRSLAESTERPPAIAEAMVDMDLEVFKVTHEDDGDIAYMSDAELKALDDEEVMAWKKGPLLEASKEGQFLEVNGAEAVEIGLANDIAGSRDMLAMQFGKRGDDIVVLESTWVDTLIGVLNTRFITVLLFIVGLIAAYMEMAAPGIGVGGLISALCFGLFFWSRFLGGTAGWLEVLLFLAGVAFILMELFVIPGFGIAGFGGILLILLSLFMASQRFTGGEGIKASDLTNTLLVITGASVASIVGMWVASQYFGGLKLFSHLTLEPPEPVIAAAGTLASGSSTDTLAPVAKGDEGIADSALRPSGRVLFGDDYRDVVTDGSFVDKGARVRVVKVAGTHITVREIES